MAQEGSLQGLHCPEKKKKNEICMLALEIRDANHLTTQGFLPQDGSFPMAGLEKWGSYSKATFN